MGTNADYTEKRDKEKDFPLTGSLFKWPQWPVLDQAKAKSQVHLHPLSGWPGSTALSHLLLLFPGTFVGTWIRSGAAEA